MRRLLMFVTLAGILAATAAPARADQDHERRRGRSSGEERRADERRADDRTQAPPVVNRAVPRTTPPARVEGPSQAYAGGYDRRGYDGRRYDHRYDGRYDRGRVVIVPRIVRPVIVSVVPYRPYFYRPTYRVYGYGSYYDPYIYPAAPYGYYNPIPGRPYGGLRITGVPRDAQVFADGYYVGVVNDFDGIFHHLNLEAGPHHIEIRDPSFQPIAFDVIVRPGETITYRAEMYGGYGY